MAKKDKKQTPKAAVRAKAKAPTSAKPPKAPRTASLGQQPGNRKRHRAIMSEWVLVRTQSGRENWARINCERQGYKVLYLRVEKAHQAKLEPLFPGYLFVLPGEQGVSKLRNTFGVVGLVPSNERVENVPLHVMREFLKMGDKSGVISLKPPTPLKPGDHYMIGHGSFQGVIGRYIGLNADKRCELLLSLFGKDVKIALPRDYIA